MDKKRITKKGKNKKRGDGKREEKEDRIGVIKNVFVFKQHHGFD